MRNLLLFGPLLWLRRVILFLLALLVILGLLLFFAANSPLAIKKVAEAYAGDYNISYDDINGNALTGIAIENPRYNNESLAKNIQLKWNPNTLAAKIITVDKLHIKEGNIDVIKALVASFTSDTNESSVDSNESSFDFTIDAENIDISLAPFVQNNISISKAILKSDVLVYKEDAFSVDDLVFALDTNVSNISLRGSMKNKVATLSDLNLDDVNLTACIALFSSEGNTSTEENISKNKSTEEEGSTSIFIPKIVKAEKLHTNILPFTYDPVKVKHITLNASDVVFDVEHLVLKEAKLDFNGTTNLSNVLYKGKAQNNHLLGNINLTPNNRLYELYGLPLRKEAIAHINVDINASTQRVIAEINAKGKHILEGKKGEFNVDIDKFISYVVYDINSAKLEAETQATVSTPYAKDIALTNTFVMDDNISYSGKVLAKRLIGLDEKLAKPLEDLKIIYSGDEKSIETKLSSKVLKGTFESKDFKTGQVHLETIVPILVNELIKLPTELKDTKINLIADAPLDFKNLTAINAKVKVASNVVNIDADVGYGKEITLKGKVEIPKDSLLKAYSKEVKWEALSPLDTNVRLSKDSLVLKLKAKALSADVNYALKQGNVKGKLNLGGLITNISGNSKQKLKIQTKITSMLALRKNLATLYAVEELPPLEGKIDVRLEVDKLKTAQLTLTAPKLTYKADRKTKHIIKDVKLVASMDASKIVLKSYKGTFNKQKYFSNKTAVITLGDNIEVSNLWVNDELKVTGSYSPKTKKGQFVADAKNFHIKDKVADIQTQIHLSTQLDGNDTIVEGKIVLLKGKITPDLQAGRSFASDSDIIILQEMKKTKKSPFMDNLTLVLKIETKEALRLKQGPINIRLKPDFTINKDKGGELLYLGSVELRKGGTYIFEEKRFVLGRSFVYFTGDVNKPVLDMKANYKSINHLITIAITGTPATPNINFSSSPSLTREQILSVILFDSEAGGDTQSGNDMMKMMGGAMAKAALADAGIAVDHLAFGEGNSIEVGKKLTNKITVIYINAEVPKVKLKYQHGKRTESVIGVSEESQSIDIIYKRDF
jgi:translocation and assembly module TamB